jgi:hypothetical protein
MAFVVRNLRLDKAELLSIVDKGASGDDDHRPRIVLMKRRDSAAKGRCPAMRDLRISACGKLIAKENGIKRR